MNDISRFAVALEDEMSRVIVGKRPVIRLLICALLARGHVLLEDVPGTGKTVLARTLATLLGGDFSRIQCTPDLLASDITGTSIYDPKKTAFQFCPGPVFTDILLADELNRATPRTQSALLESMEERQVSAMNETYPLSPSFFVIATQNPVETQGTFPLPEAQLDRFAMRLSLGYPELSQAIELLERMTDENVAGQVSPITSIDELKKHQAMVQKIHLSQAVCTYAASLCEKTRTLPDVELGISTRGMLTLMRCAQAHACMQGRDYVIPDDIKTLAEPVLAHRLIVRGGFLRPSAQANIIKIALAQTSVPTETP